MKKMLLTIFFAFISTTFYAFAEGVDDSSQKSQTSEEIPSEFKELIEKNNVTESVNTQFVEPSLIEEAKKFEVNKYKPEVDSNESKITYPLTRNETIEVRLIFALLLIFNFISHIAFPKFKGFVIATPFNIGGVRNEGSRWKRNSLESILLLAFTLSYFIYSSVKEVNEENFLLIAEKCLISFFILQLIYIVIRFLIGIRTSCPACNVTFARKTLGTTNVPLTTYTQLSNSQPSNKREPRNYDVMETGTTTENYVCISCGHEWMIKSSYRSQIGKA